MTTAEYKDYQAAASLGLIPDDMNPIFLFSQTEKELLMDLVNGKIDAVQFAKIELKNRGFDIETGRWIGWKNNEDVVEELLLVH
ncbi:MAG: hypothetical protein WC716_06890 [Chitinophagaceae bacterium]|jgi:hypothetical protein